MIVKKKIAAMRDKAAKYAEIEIEIENGKSGFRSIGGLQLVGGEWNHGVLLAISLLGEQLRQHPDRHNIALKVISFKGQVCDTSVMAVAYVTYHAIAMELAPEMLERFEFDEENWQFVIR